MNPMITFQRIYTCDTELYAYMEQLLQVSFPEQEYRPLNELREITDKQSNFHNNIILQQTKPVGLVTYWDFNSFRYIEHLAIDPAQRNGGLGKQVLEYLCPKLTPIILEVELPEDEMSIRRINFYKRQGFTLWDANYAQPPYKAGGESIPMKLMAYGSLLCDKDFTTIKQTIHTEVYHVPINS